MLRILILSLFLFGICCLLIFPLVWKFPVSWLFPHPWIFPVSLIPCPLDVSCPLEAGQSLELHAIQPLAKIDALWEQKWHTALGTKRWSKKPPWMSWYTVIMQTQWNTKTRLPASRQLTPPSRTSNLLLVEQNRFQWYESSYLPSCKGLSFLYVS